MNKAIWIISLISFISIQGLAFALPSNTSDSGSAAADTVISVHVLCAETGRLRVDLVDEATFGAPDRPLLRQEITINQEDLSQPIILSFQGLKAGRYALRAFIDRNADGRLNAGPFGPTEPWAFSWAASPKRGIPRFEDAAFQAVSGINSIQMEVRK